MTTGYRGSRRIVGRDGIREKLCKHQSTASITAQGARNPAAKPAKQVCFALA